MDKWLKIRRHDWKEPLQISQPAKFSIAWDQAPRWGVGWGGGGALEEEENKFGVGEKKSTTGGGGGGGQIIVPHHTNVCKFRDSDELYLRKFSTNLFKTWQFYLFKNFFFSGESMDFP